MHACNRFKWRFCEKSRECEEGELVVITSAVAGVKAIPELLQRGDDEGVKPTGHLEK